MPVEVEIKLKVDDVAPVRERLKQLGAVRVGEVIETNIFFDTPMRALFDKGCGLRLRRAIDLETRIEKFRITYKGKRQSGPVKRREEIEIGVDDAEQTILMFERLGFVRTLRFEKKRESWKLENSLVELDAVPQIGTFVEIECQDEAEIMRLREKLGLANVLPTVAGYPELVSRHLGDAKERSLTF